MQIHMYYILQRPDQYKMKILVFSIQYDFQILKYQYQYSIWRILNKYQYQYAKKTEVSVFSISILSGKKCEKTSKPSKRKKMRKTKQILKIEMNLSFYWIDISLKILVIFDFYYEKHSLMSRWSQYWRIYTYKIFKKK